MDFQFSDEQRMIIKMVRDFANKEILPTVEQRDEEEVFDRGILDRIGELGLMGIFFPEEYIWHGWTEKEIFNSFGGRI